MINLLKKKKRKVLIFRGNLNNVVKRAYDCCKRFDLDAFVRICGDRILFDYMTLMRQLVILLLQKLNLI